MAGFNSSWDGVVWVAYFFSVSLYFREVEFFTWDRETNFLSPLIETVKLIVSSCTPTIQFTPSLGITLNFIYIMTNVKNVLFFRQKTSIGFYSINSEAAQVFGKSSLWSKIFLTILKRLFLLLKSGFSTSASPKILIFWRKQNEKASLRSKILLK